MTNIPAIHRFGIVGCGAISDLHAEMGIRAARACKNVIVEKPMALDHGHIYGMCNGLIEAGVTIKYVYDPYAQKVESFLKAFPQARYEEKAILKPYFAKAAWTTRAQRS